MSARSSSTSVTPSNNIHLILGGLMVAVLGALVIPISMLRAQISMQTDSQGRPLYIALNDKERTTYDFEYTQSTLSKVIQRTQMQGSEQVFEFDLTKNTGNFADSTNAQHQQFTIRLHQTGSPSLLPGEAILAQWPLRIDRTSMQSITGRLEQVRIIHPTDTVWQQFFYDNAGKLTGLSRTTTENDIVKKQLIADLVRNEAVQTFGSGSERRYKVSVLSGNAALDARETALVRWSLSPTKLIPYALNGYLLSARTTGDGWTMAISYNYSGSTLTQVNRLVTTKGQARRATLNLAKGDAVVTDNNGSYRSYNMIVQDRPFTVFPAHYTALMEWSTSDSTYGYAAGIMTWYVDEKGRAQSYDDQGNIMQTYTIPPLD